MLFIIEFILLRVVFGQNNPVCSSFNKNTWVQGYMDYGCETEAPINMINGVTYRCCNECQECYKFEGAKCVIDESQWPAFNEVCTGSIEYCLQEKQQGNCGETCICKQCEGDRVWDRKNGVYACYTPEELNPETPDPETPDVPEGDDICLTYSCEQICAECASDYTLNSYGVCVPNNCYSYNTVDYVKGKCYKCIEGYFLQGGACIKIVNDNCTDYYYDGDCYQCKPGFDILDSVCVPQYCKDYIPKGSNAECTACEWNYKLVNGICVLDTDNGDNVDCLESITYKYEERYHTHCTKCPEGYLVGPLKTYCRKAKTVQWEYDPYESTFMCEARCVGRRFYNSENYASCRCYDCEDYYQGVEYLGNTICLPTNCIEPLIPEYSNVLDLDGYVHCGKCTEGYNASMNMVTGSICIKTSSDRPDWAWEDGAIKEFILLIVLLFLIM